MSTTFWSAPSSASAEIIEKMTEKFEFLQFFLDFFKNVWSN
jgi:hypothetical protein